MEEIYTVTAAAAYLGLSVSGIKYHVHKVKDLTPDRKVGNTLIFSRATLDVFAESKRRPGRPKHSS